MFSSQLPRAKVTLLCLLALLIIAGCGGGGSSGNSSNANTTAGSTSTVAITTSTASGSTPTASDPTSTTTGTTSTATPTAPARTISVLASTSNDTYYLTLAGDRIYFTNYDSINIRSVSINGGSVTTHLQPPPPPYGRTFDAPGPILVDNGTIYDLELETGGKIFSLPSSSVGATSVTTFWQAPDNGYQPLSMTKDSTNLYWVVDHYHYPDTSTYTADVFSQPLSGGATTYLGSINTHPLKIEESGNALLIVTPLAIYALPKGGSGTPTTLATTDTDGFRDVAIKNNMMYVLHTALFSVNLVTGTVTQLSKPGSVDQGSMEGATRLYLDDTHIYWTSPQGVQRLAFASLDNPSPEWISQGAAYDITGDSTSVYWANGSQVLKTDK